MSVFEAFLLGIVEGVTEFLPVSSTAHLILASHLLGIDQSESHKSFEIVVQLGSISAVIFFYFRRLVGDRRLLLKLCAAFVPTGVIGLLFYRRIKELFSMEIVCVSLIAGGILLIAVELYMKRRDGAGGSDALGRVSFGRAFLIGCAQCFAMIPGVSRSAATIIGGLLCGLDRKTAIEFSFLLAVPTMLIAAGYDFTKNLSAFNSGDLLNLLIGFTTSFFVAVLAIRGFLKFVSKFSFIPFGIYRIAIGAVFLAFIAPR
ncbi:MAG: undecaprenyl-diphosphatase UppP [Helicobacteraceae bacterium]|nr:undecaprenyl-diphosphatase UppP [Helicobacteraceae bacterium]